MGNKVPPVVDYGHPGSLHAGQAGAWLAATGAMLAAVLLVLFRYRLAAGVNQGLRIATVSMMLVACACAAGNLRAWRRWLVPVALAVLAAVAACVVDVNGLSVVGGNARERYCQSDFRTLSTALAAFRADVGRFPTTKDGLKALVEAPWPVGNWKGPYLEQPLPELDPWGNRYVYRCPGTRYPDRYDLASLGDDGAVSGDDIWWDFGPPQAGR